MGLNASDHVCFFSVFVVTPFKFPCWATRFSFSNTLFMLFFLTLFLLQPEKSHFAFWMCWFLPFFTWVLGMQCRQAAITSLASSISSTRAIPSQWAAKSVSRSLLGSDPTFYNALCNRKVSWSLDKGFMPESWSLLVLCSSCTDNPLSASDIGEAHALNF